LTRGFVTLKGQPIPEEQDRRKAFCVPAEFLWMYFGQDCGSRFLSWRFWLAVAAAGCTLDALAIKPCRLSRFSTSATVSLASSINPSAALKIVAGATRLLWVGKERTVEAFQGFFTMLGGRTHL
jgi:hypothetical protein